MDEWNGLMDKWNELMDKWNGLMDKWNGLMDEWNGLMNEWNGLMDEWNIKWHFYCSILSETRLSNSKEDSNAPQLIDTSSSTIYHIWSSHNMAITDISSTGHESNNIKIATTSLDHTCKVTCFIFDW